MVERHDGPSWLRDDDDDDDGRLPLKYMPTPVYYNMHTDTGSRTHVNVNTALL